MSTPSDSFHQPQEFSPLISPNSQSIIPNPLFSNPTSPLHGPNLPLTHDSSQAQNNTTTHSTAPPSPNPLSHGLSTKSPHAHSYLLPTEHRPVPIIHAHQPNADPAPPSLIPRPSSSSPDAAPTHLSHAARTSHSPPILHLLHPSSTSTKAPSYLSAPCPSLPLPHLHSPSLSPPSSPHLELLFGGLEEVGDSEDVLLADSSGTIHPVPLQFKNHHSPLLPLLRWPILVVDILIARKERKALNFASRQATPLTLGA